MKLSTSFIGPRESILVFLTTHFFKIPQQLPTSPTLLTGVDSTRYVECFTQEKQQQLLSSMKYMRYIDKYADTVTEVSKSRRIKSSCLFAARSGTSESFKLKI